MLLRSAALIGSVIALAACARSGDAPSKTAPAVAVAAAVIETPAPAPAVAAETPASDVEMEEHWQGFGVASCSYLAPKEELVGEDGGIDVVVHFHAGQMSEREMRASGVRGVFVSCGYGVGTSGYSRAFQQPSRFGTMLKRLTRTVSRKTGKGDVHVRRLALASWSAGFAAVSRILSVPEYYDAVDTVVLLDSLHAQYTSGEGSARGAALVDVKMLRHFVRFARDAASGKKTMVITHSAIVPPDYASTSESTAALLDEVGVTAVPTSGKTMRSMALALEADERGLHVRGFRGTGPQDHFGHLHMIGDTLRSWLVPRWYTASGERP